MCLQEYDPGVRAGLEVGDAEMAQTKHLTTNQSKFIIPSVTEVNDENDPSDESSIFGWRYMLLSKTGFSDDVGNKFLLSIPDQFDFSCSDDIFPFEKHLASNYWLANLLLIESCDT